MPTEISPAENTAAESAGSQELGAPPPGFTEPAPADAALFARQRQRRNWAVAGALVGFAVLIFLVTLVRLSGNIAQLADRPL